MSEYQDRLYLKARRRIVKDSSVLTRELSILESSNLNDVRKKSFHLFDNLDNIMKVMKTEFCLSPDAETRTWTSKIPDLNALRLLSDQDNSLEKEEILHGHYLIIEVKNQDETWPKDVSYHKRSQYVSHLSHGPENQEY